MNNLAERNTPMSTRFLALLMSLVVLCMLISCGGGTTGTGAQTYEGSVFTTKEQPVPNIRVTILETGDSAVTDASGGFSIPTAVTTSTVNLKLEGDQVDATYQVKTASADDSKVQVTIHIDEETREVSVSEFAAQVGMVGQCDHYFENHDVIRQANQVPDGTVCTLKVVLYGDGVLQADLPVELQVRGCEPATAWQTLSIEKTGAGIKRGVAQISFDYQSTRVFCEYRVLAPVSVHGYVPLDYRIETFRYQNRK